MTILFTVFLFGYGGKEEKKKEGFGVEREKTSTEKSVGTSPVAEAVPASSRNDLSNEGVGPITLKREIDQEMA